MGLRDILQCAVRRTCSRSKNIWVLNSADYFRNIKLGRFHGQADVKWKQKVKQSITHRETPGTLIHLNQTESLKKRVF